MTPTRETPFAGHPTVGTAFVLLQRGIVSSSCHEFLLEEEVGPIPLRIEAGTPPLIWLRKPAIHEGRCLDGSLCARALGLAARPACSGTADAERRKSDGSGRRKG